MRDGLLGQITQPATSNALEPDVPWCADNGCFSAKWDPATWLRFLDRHTAHLDTCLFAVVPDVVADHAATVDRFGEWAHEVRDRGFPVAFVGQDGATVETTPWDEFDAWFAGGSTAWKLGDAWAIHAEARRRGKHTHMGRVNSRRRYLAAAAGGYDTVDGTFLAFGPDTNLPRLLSWVREERTQMSMGVALA